jgi:hypothetical protein
MAQYAPQVKLYNIISRMKNILEWIFWLIFAISIVPTLSQLFAIPANVQDVLNIINIILLILYFLLDIIVDLVFLPEAEKKRMDDFIDNSFDSKFNADSSIDYYDNEEIRHGLYKAGVNLFQNCYTTFQLIKLLTTRKIIIPAVALITIGVISYYGFREVPFFLTLLQVVFSTSILGGLIRHLMLFYRLSQLHDDWIKLFQLPDFTSTNGKYNTYILRNWLRYETLLAKIPAGIPDRFFEKYNNELTQKWLAMKSRYSIQ